MVGRAVLANLMDKNTLKSVDRVEPCPLRPEIDVIDLHLGPFLVVPFIEFLCNLVILDTFQPPGAKLDVILMAVGTPSFKSVRIGAFCFSLHTTLEHPIDVIVDHSCQRIYVSGWLPIFGRGLLLPSV